MVNVGVALCLFHAVVKDRFFYLCWGSSHPQQFKFSVIFMFEMLSSVVYSLVSFCIELVFCYADCTNKTASKVCVFLVLTVILKMASIINL